jgi:hypothetical protein
MINASFSSPDGEPSMQEEDEENALLNSNQDQLPRHPPPNDQTITKLEGAAVKALHSLNGNNGKRKANESEKRIMVFRGGKVMISITTGCETECKTFSKEGVSDKALSRNARTSATTSVENDRIRIRTIV